MSTIAFNQLKVRCNNPICKYYDILRTATLPLVGGDLYVNAPILCQCGMVPNEVEKGDKKHG